MMDCPHVAAPLPHEINLPAQSVDPIRCDTCHLSVRRCPQCGDPNRIAARHCRRCGSALDPLMDPDLRLLAPGLIRDAVKDAPRFRLEQILSLKESWEPVAWYRHPEGLFIFAWDTASKTTPVALYFLPGCIFTQSTVRPLSATLPTTLEWIQPPVVVPDGLYLATSQSLVCFPTHGYAEPFPQIAWQPHPGQQVRSIAPLPDGTLAVLLSRASGEISLAFGNSQTKTWREPHPLALPPATIGAIVGAFPGDRTRCWVYDGDRFAVVQVKSGAVERCVDIGGVKPPLNQTAKEKIGFFSPFVINPAGCDQRLVFPMLTSQYNACVPAAMPVSAVTREVVQTTAPPRSWVQSDPAGAGYFCGSTDAFGYYETSAATEWKLPDGVLPAARTLVASQRWLACVTEASPDATYAPAGRPHPQLHTYEVSRTDGAIKLAAICHPPLPITGTLPSGMPPINVRDSLLIPIRHGSQRHETFVYQIKILDS